MIAFKLKLKRSTIHITPEMAQHLMIKGYIVLDVPKKRFKSVDKDELVLWREMRA